MSKIKIGVVTAYFTRISVVEVELSYDLFVGDNICIGENRTKVNYLQIENDRVSSASAGETVALKINFAAKIGDEVTKRI